MKKNVLKELRSSLSLLAFLCVLFAAAHRVEAQQSSLYEQGAPLFRGIELQLPKNNLLTRELGTRADRIHFYGGQFFTVDDNIYLRDEDETGDNILTTLGGMSLRLDRSTMSAELDADVRHEEFDRHDEDNTEYKVSPSFTALLTERLKLNLAGGFRSSTGPLDDLGAQITEDQITSRTYEASAGLEYQMDERWAIATDYGHSTKKYRESEFSGLERSTNTVSITPTYAVSEKTKVGTVLEYGEIDYKEEYRNESDWVDARLSLNSLPSPKVEIYADVGHQHRDYDDDGTLVADDENFHGVVYRGSLSYAYSEQWTWTLSAFRTAAEGSITNSNYYTISRQAITATYLPVAPLKLRVSVFTDQISPSQDSDSNRTGGAVGASYMLSEWAGLGASYEFTTKGSDELEDGEYDRNVGTAGLWVTF